VEDSWEYLEFTVIPHHGYKYAYVLGENADIQQLVDDSLININTIASSRHVSPIKPQVDVWLCQLHLFSNTLVSGEKL
jgi:dynein heavy chain